MSVFALNPTVPRNAFRGHGAFLSLPLFRCLQPRPLVRRLPRTLIRLGGLMNAALGLVVLSQPAGFLAAGLAAPLPSTQAGRIGTTLPVTDALCRATVCLESDRPAEALDHLDAILCRPRSEAEVGAGNPGEA